MWGVFPIITIGPFVPGSFGHSTWADRRAPGAVDQSDKYDSEFRARMERQFAEFREKYCHTEAELRELRR